MIVADLFAPIYIYILYHAITFKSTVAFGKDQNKK